MLFQNAQIHHDEDAGLARLFGGCLMDHALLHPDRGSLDLDCLIHYFGYCIGPAKYVNDVDLARHIEQ